MKKSRFVGRQKGIQTVYMGVKQVDGGGGTPSWFAQAREKKREPRTRGLEYTGSDDKRTPACTWTWRLAWPPSRLWRPFLFCVEPVRATPPLHVSKRWVDFWSKRTTDDTLTKARKRCSRPFVVGVHFLCQNARENISSSAPKTSRGLLLLYLIQMILF